MAIWKGAVKDVIWPEGPHLYKIGEYYYLMHAEGGTGPEHSISIARSKSLFQWFEGCPRNPIFTHRNLGTDYPVIYAGHGDLVEDGYGNWYVVMLASRPCKKHCSMGRETFIAKVIWENGWPVIAPGVGHLEEKIEIPMEEVRFPEEIGKTDALHFRKKGLDQRLVGIGKRNEQIYSLTANEGMLRLYNRKEKITETSYCSYLGLRQKSYSFRVSTGVTFLPQKESECAGIVLYQNHENHLRIEIKKKAVNKCLAVITCIHGEETEIACTEIVWDNQMVEICMRCDAMEAAIWVRTGEAIRQVAEKVNLLPYTTEEAGGFVGCTVGMYASSNGEESDNYADFGWFELTGK